jgi:uncharacterized protein (TIGR03066 family)
MSRFMGLVGLAALLTGTPAKAQDKSMLTGETWTVVKSEHAPPGTTVQFGADGKMTLTVQVDGKKQQMPGTYTLSGTQLVFKFTNNGREITDARVVKKLTASSLVTEDRNKKMEELSR